MFYIRCKYWDNTGGGVGFLDDKGRAVIDIKWAKSFDSEAEAWDFAINSDNMGHDKDGEYCWVEEV